LTGVIITKEKKIPTKRISKVLGDISVKKFMWTNERPEKCYEKLKKKAEIIGADGVINVEYHPSEGLGWYGSCTGLAVKLEPDLGSICSKCKKEVPIDSYAFCPSCGTKKE
jgi:uncharacterized protein YbjQ (UPF0145 family)